MSVTIYHNPRCSKSRQTLALLHERDVELRVIEYLEQPPSPEKMDQILRLLDLEPRELMRPSEAPSPALNLASPAMAREALIDAMCANPMLIQRPIVLANGKAAVGRPPERALEIL